MSCDSYADLMGQPMPIEVVGTSFIGTALTYRPSMVHVCCRLWTRPPDRHRARRLRRFASGSPTLADVRPRTAGCPIASTRPRRRSGRRGSRQRPLKKASCRLHLLMTRSGHNVRRGSAGMPSKRVVYRSDWDRAGQLCLGSRAVDQSARLSTSLSVTVITSVDPSIAT